MIEKLVSFLPPIIVLSSIVVILVCLYKFIPSRLLDKEKLRSPKYAAQWGKEHKVKLILMTILAVSLYGPALEELVFRTPLIIIFDTLSGHAWIGILVSSVVFAAIHYSSKFAVIGFERMKEFSAANGEPEEKIEYFESKRETFLKAVKIGRVISSFLAGILLGYLAIKYQSLYLCFGVHAVWNLVLRHIFGILAGIIVAISSLIFPLISEKIDDLKWFLRQRRRKNNY